MNTLSKTLLVLALVGLIVGLILYFRGTVMVEVTNAPVTIDKYTRYVHQGFFSDAYYSEIQVTPTSQAEPNMKYLLVMDNGIVKQNYKVSWSQLELAIQKPKTLTIKVSQDEYTALGMQGGHLTAFEIKPQRRIIYLVPGIVLLAALLSYYVVLKSRRVPSKSRGLPSSSPVPQPSRVMGSVPTSPEGKAWQVPPGGLPSDIPPSSAGERAGYAVAEPRGGIFGLRSSSEDFNFLTNLKINDLYREGKIDIKEAESIRRQIKNMDFIEQQSFLHDIEFRDEDE